VRSDLISQRYNGDHAYTDLAAETWAVVSVVSAWWKWQVDAAGLPRLHVISSDATTIAIPRDLQRPKAVHFDCVSPSAMKLCVCLAVDGLRTRGGVPVLVRRR
jgi:L-asparaginase II